MPDPAAARPVPAPEAAAATTTAGRPGIPATPSEAAARGDRAAADAPATLRAYRADLSCFRPWCAQKV